MNFLDVTEYCMNFSLKTNPKQENARLSSQEHFNGYIIDMKTKNIFQCIEILTALVFNTW